ncbi:conserved protein of unknown function [Bradyrhizobium sp. ORS 285]|nr:conserved hypothetical protein [Bradyrhizobium sp. ORS 285]SMX56590.1 conserved protein of unknown function [Bradyrhizobium sp. ORS 285]
MLEVRNYVYEPEELLVLGDIFDRLVTALPETMRTQANRTEIAKIVLSRTKIDERELAEIHAILLTIGSAK